MSNGRMTTVVEAIVAVEGEPGDDGTVWTMSMLQEIVRLTNQRRDARAWMESRPDGLHQVRIRVDAPGGRPKDRIEGRDLERLRKAAEKRLRKANQKLEHVATFRIRSAE